MWVSYRVALYVIGKQCYWKLKWYLSILESNFLPSRVFLNPSRSFPILQLKINLGFLSLFFPPISETPTGIERSTLVIRQNTLIINRERALQTNLWGPAPQPLK
ncbi:hypothetical protein NEUTE2DRAFT_113705 [Neurospora tetrasperma FGSC 2509]|nr:hypothetical protein NEUTE2DRAFT_113705 [Neurospora tetrasperma FGSC 2509]